MVIGSHSKVTVFKPEKCTTFDGFLEFSILVGTILEVSLMLFLFIYFLKIMWLLKLLFVQKFNSDQSLAQ